MKPRFLLDEHVKKAIQRQLRRMAPNMEILTIGDPEAPAAGTSDPEILIWLEQNNYILVTENRRTIPQHVADHFAAGRNFPGVFWIRPGAGIGVVVEELYLIWLTSEAEEYQNCTFFIPM